LQHHVLPNATQRQRGRIGSAAVESIARQPEMAGRIFVNMILTAALVEGVALFAVVVGLLGFNKA
jgi:F-type H+-transporting ATPase subunit c